MSASELNTSQSPLIRQFIERPLSSRLVPQFLLPGIAQIAWQQRERGWILLGTFSSALMIALLCWGTFLGDLFLAVSVLVHLAGTLDILRQRSFPNYPRAVASLSAVVAIGLTVYLPVAGALYLLAFPASSQDEDGASYLINRLTFQGRSPAVGDWIWLRSSPDTPSRTGRVIAVAGQEVEWSAMSWRVNGIPAFAPPPGTRPPHASPWRFRVPDDHVVIRTHPLATRVESQSPIQIVSRDQIVGKAWARSSPFWDRTLL